MTASDFYTLALIAASVVALFGLLDFLIGASGRRWVKENVIFRSWYQLSILDLQKILQRSAERYAWLLTKIFGGEYAGRSAITFFLLLLLLSPLRSIIDGILVGEPFNMVFIARDISYVPPDIAAGLTFIGYPFAYLSFVLTRCLVSDLADRGGILKGITTWSYDIFATAMIALFMVHFIDYFSADWVGKWTANSRNYSISALTPFNLIAVFVPSLVHLLFVLTIIFLSLLESARQSVIFILERVDETGSSPLLIMSGMFTGIATIFIAIARIISSD